MNTKACVFFTRGMDGHQNLYFENTAFGVHSVK